VYEAFSVAGWVLFEDTFMEGHVRIDDGIVSAVEAGPSPEPPVAEGIILPGLNNHHTHVGDAAVPPPPPDLGPGEVFAPPNGYKHRMLEKLPDDRLEAGVTDFIDSLTRQGTVEHTDFREGGVGGVTLLRRAIEAAEAPPRCCVYGRPTNHEFETSELEQLLGVVHGIGLSAVMDWPKEPILDVVAAAHDAGKPVALHCSESRREELSWVLDLEPEFVVHMVFGTDTDFRDLAAAGIPVVVCPRSTHRYTKAPPVWDMVRAGVDVRLGTDNAMLQGPSVLDEVAFLLEMPKVRSVLGPIDVLAWALSSAKGSNKRGDIGVSTGSGDLAVLPFAGDDPTSFIERPHEGGAVLVMTDGRIWRR
jgi:cytosine/adenosine deaminase-related metal-dependent hydrolase